MSSHEGPAKWWAANTDTGRTHIATKGIVTSSLVLNLDAGVSSSYPGSGTTWTDLSTTKSSATLTNGPTYTSSNGGCIVFDGSNDSVDTGYDLSWNNTNDASVTLWCQPSATLQNAGIVGKPSPNWEWCIKHGSAASSPTNDSLVFVYWNSSGGHTNGPIITISNFFVADTWVFIGVTWSASANQIKIYKNGALANTTTWTDASINQNRTNNVYLGGAIYSWNTGYWSGNLSNLQLYNGIALSGAQIQQNFNALRSRFGI